MPIYEKGVVKDSQIEFTYLNIFDQKHEVILNSGDYRNNILRINKQPGVIKYGQDKTELPEEWVQDSLLDMSEFESQNAEKIKDHISPYSPEKLQYVFVDPDTKQIIRPKLIRGKDGKLYLKMSMLSHHSYMAIQTVFP